jgi:ComF family protein
VTGGIVSDLLDLLFPAVCLACRHARSGTAGLCADCARGLEGAALVECLACRAEGSGVPASRGDHARARLLAPYVYAGPLVELVHELKYGGRRDLARPLGGAMAERLGEASVRDGCRFALLLPLPLHPSRERERGYNQSALLAREISRSSGVPVPAERLLRRTRRTRAQAGLGPARRGENVRGAFAADRSPLLEGKEVVLVDDVATTGATALAAARALLAAGAAGVLVLAAGRTPLPRPESRKMAGTPDRLPGVSPCGRVPFPREPSLDHPDFRSRAVTGGPSS